jgi:hypothetical protein
VGKALLTTEVKRIRLTNKINSKTTLVSRDGVGDIATDIHVRAAELEVQNQVEEIPFRLDQTVRICFGVQPASYSWASDILHGGKAA